MYSKRPQRGPVCHTVVRTIFFGLAISIGARSTHGQQTAPNYQSIAEGAKWTWEDDRADALSCALRGSGEYSVTLAASSAKGPTVEVAVSASDKRVYAWKGNEWTVFRIVGSRLYYMSFSPAAPGGTLVA